MEFVLSALLVVSPLIAAAVLVALTADGKRWLRLGWHWLRPRRLRPRRLRPRRLGRREIRGRRGAAASAGRRPAARHQGAASDLRRYAEEVSVAAERAMIRAERTRAQWLAAADEAEAAWTAFESADAEVRRLAAAAVLPEPWTPRTPAEYADRERYLHNAAMAAASRGELPVLKLSDALANRNGWDPRRHPVDQELILGRARRDAALGAYRAAAGRERAAWRDCEIAAVAAQSLRTEAHAARHPTPAVSWSDSKTVAMPVMAPKTPRRTARPAEPGNAAPLRTAHAG
jgi:hypothetical protein